MGGKKTGGINKIRQIVRLKQVMHRWRSSSSRHVSNGQLPVEVGPDRNRFSVPARFVNLPVFMSLLNEAQEEFGYRPEGVLSLPSCDPGLFRVILDFLELDEDRYGRVSILEFSKFVASSSDDHDDNSSSSCKDTDPRASANQPLLQKA